MACSRCGAEIAESASYCHRCGTSAGDGGARRRYAVTTGESVGQPAVISTIMPHADSDALDSFRWALLAGAAVILGTTLAGFVPLAIIEAAFLVPAAYLVYIYTVNLWQDTPLRVVLALFGVVGVASLVVSLAFFQWLFADQFRAFASSGSVGFRVPAAPLLIFAVALPLVAEVVKNVPSVLLARMPQFDDQIDGLTFGIAAGAAYAAVESVVSFWPVITGDLHVAGSTSWVAIVLNLMVVKTLIYGTATGLAVAAFSGRGQGYAGFTGKYFAAFTVAVGANVLYWIGVRLTAGAPAGSVLGLLWGVVILAVLLVRLRSTLQSALVEAALEGSVAGASSGTCPECRASLGADSQFCSACGTSVRAAPAQVRRQVASDSDQTDLAARLGRRGILVAVLAAVVGLGAVGAIVAGAKGTSAKPPEAPPVGDIFTPGKPLNPSAVPNAHGGAGGRVAQLLGGRPLAAVRGELVPDPDSTAGPVDDPTSSGTTISLTSDSSVDVGPEWEVYELEGGGALIQQGDVTMGIFTFSDVAGDDAVALAAPSQDLLFGSSSWVQKEFSDAQPDRAAGSVVSLAYYGYQATWSDQQGSSDNAGIVILAIRGDHQLLVLRTMAPPSEFDQSIDLLSPVISDTLNAFAGLS